MPRQSRRISSKPSSRAIADFVKRSFELASVRPQMIVKQKGKSLRFAKPALLAPCRRMATKHVSLRFLGEATGGCVGACVGACARVDGPTQIPTLWLCRRARCLLKRKKCPACRRCEKRRHKYGTGRKRRKACIAASPRRIGCGDPQPDPEATAMSINTSR